MITQFILFVEEAEITPNNTMGTAGDGSQMATHADGYARSGGLNGEFGNSLTPKGDHKAGTYKKKRTKKRRFIKNIIIK